MTLEDQPLTDGAFLAKIEREITTFYIIWFSVYLLLGVGSIALPILAAMGVEGSRYLAGLGGLAAALYGFLKPNEYIASFDAASAECRSLRQRLGRISDFDKDQRLDHIHTLMSFKYDGAIGRIKDQLVAAAAANQASPQIKT